MGCGKTLLYEQVEGHEESNRFAHFFCSLIQCSTECGSGTQQREVICVRKTEGNFDVLNPYECSYLEKPPSQQSCYLKPCGSKWFHTEWSTVSLSCFPVSVLCLIHLFLFILEGNTNSHTTTHHEIDLILHRNDNKKKAYSLPSGT